MYQHIAEFQAVLKKNNAAAALLRLPENLVFFTQYWPRYGFSFLFIPADGDPWVICPEVEQEDTKHFGVENVIPVGDVKLEDGDPVPKVIGILRKLSKDHGISAGRTIAVEGGEDMIAPTFVSNKVQLCGDTTRKIISEGFGTGSFFHAKDEISILRRIKNSSDIERLDKVNQLLHKALDYFEEILETPGIREIDALMDTQAYFSKIAAGFNGSLASRAYGQLTTGLRSYTAWADGVFSNERVIENGDVAMYEVGAVVDGYWADLTRTGCKGGFHGRKKEIADIVRAAFEAGVAAAKDGATGHDVDKAARDIIEKAGYGQYFVHNTGHGVGFVHSEGYPVLAPGSADVLQTNMVVAVEPGIYVPEIGGIRLEENVLVTKTGGRILGRTADK